MKEKRSLLWRWCPQPERMRVTRTRPTDRPWVPLVAAAVLLSLLAIQSVQILTPSAVNAIYPNYGSFPAVQPFVETLNQTALPSQTVTTVSTDHFTIQLTFPESADPGKTITISTVTTAKSSKQVNSLSIEVLAYVNKQLAKVATATVLTDRYVYSGNTWQTTLTVTILQSIDRSMMIGTVTERWEETSSYYQSYGYWPYYPDYPNYYPYNYTDWPYYPNHLNYYPYNYPYEPSYVTVEKSSQQTIPLTYVLATTPEYEQLSAQHKQLQQEYDSLLAKHNDLSSKYESLRSDHDQLAAKYNQLGVEYEAASTELNNFRIYTYVLIVVTVALAGLVAFLLFQRAQISERPKKQDR